MTKRGHYLLAWGIGQALLGLAFITGPGPGATEGRQLAFTLLPVPVYCTLSLIVSALAVAAALWRPSLERWAFGALAVVTFLRCAAFLCAGMWHGDASTLTGGVAFALLLRIHLLVSDWQEEPGVAAVVLTQADLERLAVELRRRAET